MAIDVARRHLVSARPHAKNGGAIRKITFAVQEPEVHAAFLAAYDEASRSFLTPMQ